MNGIKEQKKFPAGRGFHTHRRGFFVAFSVWKFRQISDLLKRVAHVVGQLRRAVADLLLHVLQMHLVGNPAVGRNNAHRGSGSGPTVFGIFDDKEKMERAAEGLRAGGLAKTVFSTEVFNRRV